MIKVNYDKQTGKILGYYAAEFNYPNGIPEPYIEIASFERNELFNVPEGKEFKVDLSTLHIEYEAIEYEETESVEVEVDDEEAYEEFNEETGEFDTKYRTIKRTETKENSVTKTRAIPHYKGKIKLYDIEYTSEELTEKERAKTVADTKSKIYVLKKQLADMDYKTSKHADGDYTEIEWQEIVAERKELRRQIKALESKFARVDLV